jgi:transcriptional regulator with XRE-family HTH domain
MTPQFTTRVGRLRPKFPNRIREYRLRAGLTQKRLGDLVGKGRSIISAWERGRTLPTLPHVFRLARALSTLSESLYAALYFPPRDDGSTNHMER